MDRYAALLLRPGRNDTFGARVRDRLPQMARVDLQKAAIARPASSVQAWEKPLRGRPVETMTVPATTVATANPAPNSVVMYFAQPTGAVSGSNMP